LGVTIAAAGFNCRGCELWKKDNQDAAATADPRTWQTIVKSPDFSVYISENRFKEYRKVIAKIWENDQVKDTDPWWEFSSAIDEFNQQRRDLIQPSMWMVEDESMSAWCPRKTKTGGLPNISFIMRKPEPLGTVSFICLFVFFFSLNLLTLFF
jgi:hypothetical protein